MSKREFDIKMMGMKKSLVPTVSPEPICADPETLNPKP